MTETNHRFRDCVWLLIAQAIGAFNDNATKAMLPALAALVIGKAEMDPVNQQVSFMLIVPFVLFGPLAGWLSDWPLAWPTALLADTIRKQFE